LRRAIVRDVDVRGFPVRRTQHARVREMTFDVDCYERANAKLLEELRARRARIPPERHHVQRPLAEAVEASAQPPHASMRKKSIATVDRRSPAQSRSRARGTRGCC